MANGRGPSLELCDPNANNSLGVNWRHAIEYQAKTPAGDSIWASPLDGCSYLPFANFLTSDSTITLGQSVVFTDVSTGNIDSWFWEFERGVPETFSGPTPPPVTYNILGAYDVTLTVRNNAGKSVRYKPAFIQVGPTGVYELMAKTGFSIHPNPVTQGLLRVTFANAGKREVTILTTAGDLVHTQVSLTVEASVNLGSIAKGLYFIRVKDLETGFTNIQKLIVQ
jgi:PKD repeat protein